MRRPRYYRAKRSHGFYTNHWHLYLFFRQPFFGASSGHTTGFTVKHRRRATRGGKRGTHIWRHVTLRHAKYQSFNPALRGRVSYFEVTTHLSRNFKKTGGNRSRIPGSKRYIRLKVCV